jgi:hypothetical protein
MYSLLNTSGAIMAQKKGKSHAGSGERPMATALQRIEFHGHELYSLRDERSGKVYVLPKRFCEILGIAWQSQLARLKRNQLFSEAITVTDIPSPSGEQETVILELDRLHAWLLSISSKRVAKEKQEMLLVYQRECAQVLHDYWTKGLAVNPRAALDHFPELRAIVELAESTAQARLLAIEAKAEAEAAKVEASEAKANADRAMETQLFFTVAEYVYINKLAQQLPESAYKACSDFLRLYCLDHNIPFRKQAIGGKRWQEEYAYHISVYVEVLPGWLTRRYAQSTFQVEEEPTEYVTAAT